MYKRGAVKFDFDNPPSRANTHAEKYTARQRLFGRPDVLPFWVADMEFAVAPVIREALATRASHPVYGYTSVYTEVIEAITAWNRKRYNITFDKQALTLVPGVMSGVSAALYAFTGPGDGVVVQPPLYPPLANTVRTTGRLLLENPLILQENRYRMNFDELEHLFKTRQPGAMLFCSPHNPVGRVWSRDEVERVVALTRRYGVCLISDEIHADIVFSPHKIVSALSCTENDIGNIIILNSASKTFNVAGLNTAYAVIPDKKLHISFRRQLARMNLHGVNIFGLTALEAACRGGEEWLEKLLLYLQGNRQYMADRLTVELPGLQYFFPEGTYLFWLNFNSTGLSPREIAERLIHKAGVGLNNGSTFSTANEGFWRFNFAVPRSMLEQGLDRIIEAFQ